MPEDQPPQLAALDGRAHRLVAGSVRRWRATPRRTPAVAAGGDHGVRVGQAEGHRLLDQDVLAGAGGGQGLGRVPPAGGAHADGVHVGAGQERLVARLAGHAELRGGVGGAEASARRHRDEPAPGVAAIACAW